MAGLGHVSTATLTIPTPTYRITGLGRRSFSEEIWGTKGGHADPAHVSYMWSFQGWPVCAPTEKYS